MPAYKIPRLVWSYWEQGERQAPDVVRVCLGRMKKINPDWTIHVLNGTTVREWIPHRVLGSLAGWPTQKKSNQIRLELLARYGGIWIDPTVLVHEPFTRWVPPIPKDSLFAFTGAFPQMKLDNWFLAAHANSEFIGALRALHQEFFSRKRDHRPRRGGRLLLRLSDRTLERNWVTSTSWVTGPLSRLPVYPYFAMHYMINLILITRPGLLSRHELETFPSGQKALSIQFFSRSAEALMEGSERKVISEIDSPASKLSHHLGKPEFWQRFLGTIE